MRTCALLIALVSVLAVAGAASAASNWTKSRCERTIRTAQGFRPGSKISQHPLTVRQRRYALQMFRSGPYTLPAMNMIYGVEAARVRAESKTTKQKFLDIWHSLGTTAVVAQVAAAEDPGEAAYYGLTARQDAKAQVQGAIAGVHA